jgi:hypothetical protein
MSEVAATLGDVALARWSLKYRLAAWHNYSWHFCVFSPLICEELLLQDNVLMSCCCSPA